MRLLTRSLKMAALVTLAAVGMGGAARLAAQSSGAAPAQALDFESFKARVEPVFLKKRAGHARCYTCHAESNNALRLERLSPGSTFWSEEQSRRNFQAVSLLVVPGNTASSRFLLHPLAPEEGGSDFHSGGRQFASRNDADWQTLAEWVRGQKAGGSSAP